MQAGMRICPACREFHEHGPVRPSGWDFRSRRVHPRAGSGAHWFLCRAVLSDTPRPSPTCPSRGQAGPMYRLSGALVPSPLAAGHSRSASRGATLWEARVSMSPVASLFLSGFRFPCRSRRAGSQAVIPGRGPRAGSQGGYPGTVGGLTVPVHGFRPRSGRFPPAPRPGPRQYLQEWRCARRDRLLCPGIRDPWLLQSPPDPRGQRLRCPGRTP